MFSRLLQGSVRFIRVLDLPLQKLRLERLLGDIFETAMFPW